MKQRLKHVLAALAGAAAVTLAAVGPAGGHETDQYTLPYGRQFTDLGPFLNAWFYDHVAEGVRRTNEKIANAKQFNRPREEIERNFIDDEIVRAVNSAFPSAMSVIEALDLNHLGKDYPMEAPPGYVLEYKEALTNIYQHAHFILDPRQVFRIWLAKTMVVYGTYMGTDKIGHFTDMGMHYWNAYYQARSHGATEEEATANAVDVGTHGLIFSERGMLGYLSAGSYSNGDIAADFLGFLFYRNLTAPVMLKGKQVPPMLVREGDFWRISPRVQRDNDFFADFVCDHLNELLNPSRYEEDMRPKIREAVKARQNSMLERYVDENGCRRSMDWFNAKARECFTYFGTDYGHVGKMDELITLGNTCFDPLPEKVSKTDRNDRGYTALHDAVIRGDRARVQALLVAGADINAAIRSGEPYSSEWGATPLHLAARDGRREIVELLLQNGAKTNIADDRGATALHYGAAYPGIASILIGKGADANAHDILGRTPLHWAANLGKADGAEALMKRGANVSAADRFGATPLHLAALRGDARCVSRMVDNGANVNAADRFGVTPLQLAARLQDAEAATVLLDHRASAVAKDAFGVTPLHEAAQQGRTAVVEALLAHGASANTADLNGVTPLHLAARSGHDQTAQAMLARGANPNARSAVGVTPLHEAAFSGRATIISALTTAGSDRAARDTRGRTPRDVATTRGHTDVLALLTGPPVNAKSASNGNVRTSALAEAH